MKKRAFGAGLGAGGALLLVAAWFAWGVFPGGSAAYPTRSGQPILFSHELHAGDLSIDCASCHTGVTESASARLPSVKQCADCHRAQPSWNRVKAVNPRSGYTQSLNTRDDVQREIGKLKWFWNQRRPIPWVKVNDLPDHVQFEHAPHVTRGISCASCHGNVTETVTPREEVDLDMQFCVSCHMNSTLAGKSGRAGSAPSTSRPDTASVFRPAAPIRRLKNRQPATWRTTDPHRRELRSLAKEFDFDLESVRFDCATCHR